MTRLPLIALVVLVLAGCTSGGDDADPDDGTTSTTSPPSTTPTTEPASSASPSSSSTTTSSGPQPTACAATPCTINIQGSDFVDGSIVVRAGGAVRWVMKDTGTTHTATSDDDGATFDSGNLAALPTQDTFEHVFDAAGSFPYHCDVHPGMKDTITVIAA